MTTRTTFLSKVIGEPNSGCWLWLGAIDGGVSWRLFRGDIPIDLCVLHKCDTPSCCNPDHLFLGTNADNIADKINKGRDNYAKGAVHCRAKVTLEDVLAIRSSNARNVAIAEQYGVHPQTISDIRKRKHWKHV